jgi:hypothetical protein
LNDEDGPGDLEVNLNPPSELTEENELATTCELEKEDK